MTPTPLAEQLYTAGQSPRPAWSQLGQVTQSVWVEMAKRKLAGDPYWYSMFSPLVARQFHKVITSTTGKIMSELNYKKLAEQFDELAEQMSAIAGTFRNAGGAVKDSGDDGKAASKPAARKGKTTKVEADDGADDLSIDTVREKLKELVDAKGKDKMVEALESVGAGKLADVDQSQYQELIDKAQELIDEEDAPAKKPAAKKPATKGKKTGPTLDEVKEAAQTLIDADRAAYVKLTKKLGKPTEMDESDYAAAIEAYKDAMPEESDDDDDEDDIDL